MASVNPEVGATMARRLNQSRVSAVLQSNLIAITFGKGRSTTSELGLRLLSTRENGFSLHQIRLSLGMRNIFSASILATHSSLDFLC